MLYFTAHVVSAFFVYPRRVFCVSDEKGEERPYSGGDLVAVAEVSLQVPNGKTAPPFPVPLAIKKASLRIWSAPVILTPPP